MTMKELIAELETILQEKYDDHTDEDGIDRAELISTVETLLDDPDSGVTNYSLRCDDYNNFPAELNIKHVSATLYVVKDGETYFMQCGVNSDGVDVGVMNVKDMI